MTTLADLVGQIGSGAVEVLDLTAPLSAATPILHLPEPFGNTISASLEPISDFDDDGPMWSWNNLHTGEHTGTHLDAPTHWITGRDGSSVDTIPPERLIGPAVVVDVVAEVEQNPDFLLEPEHLEAWQREHGPIPAGAWLILRTGWGARSRDAERFANADENGPHTPGPSVAAARWLAETSPITGFGVETVGIDAGSAAGFDPIFPAHYFLLGNDKYGLTQLQNVDKLPPRGAVLVVAPLPIVGGTGSPARVFALIERD
ncbi:cyclase family protein [Aldersonia sp. NBC_00410]|jgi:kynurenine formamidase|uniref:cyclase family protein n=1 Tax=Aldersonia sp. NBC_00410 TaxID=2975954 RepID=UPI00224EBD6C|nr:cyclase family protein [Aldersonia sp. NBC_00410]MCX5043812.1 cyclase family protein [Aldersonia sp. NBC_00410]